MAALQPVKRRSSETRVTSDEYRHVSTGVLARRVLVAGAQAPMVVSEYLEPSLRALPCATNRKSDPY